MSGAADQKWTKDESGKLVMPPKQSDYLDWLLSETRDPPTEPEWCALKGVAQDTVRKWRADRRFREMWERRSVEMHVSPDKMHRVLGVLFKSATSLGDVAAAKSYLAYMDKFMPPKQVQRDASVAHMTDAELRQEIEGILDAGFGL